MKSAASGEAFRKPLKKPRAKFRALADANFSVRENEFVSIIGPSGCGKTTFLKMIDGLIPWDGGEGKAGHLELR